MSADNLDLVMDVALVVSVEVGRSAIRLRDVLQLGVGSLVALDRAAGAPADLFVNDKLVARGEIVALEEHYGIKIAEMTVGQSAAAGSSREG